MRLALASMAALALAGCSDKSPQANETVATASASREPPAAPPVKSVKESPEKDLNARDRETWLCDGAAKFRIVITRDTAGAYVADGTPWGDQLDVIKKSNSYIIDGEHFGFKKENGNRFNPREIAWFSSETGDAIFCKLRD